MTSAIENYFETSDTSNIEIVEEQPHNESDEFLEHF